METPPGFEAMKSIGCTMEASISIQLNRDQAIMPLLLIFTVLGVMAWNVDAVPRDSAVTAVTAVYLLHLRKLCKLSLGGSFHRTEDSVAGGGV